MAENKKNSPLKLDPLLITGGIFLAAKGINALRRGARRRRAELKRAQEEFDRRIRAYEESEFQEIDPDQYRQENVFEDVTVDTEAQEFASEQFKQQQANIMQAFRGVTGSSGIGALAQSLSNQAAKAAKQNQVEISKQLAQNKKLRLAEQSRLQEQQRALELNNALGRRQFEADKMATMIGVAGQKVAGASQRIANVQSMYGEIIGGLSEIAASAVTPTG
jgi:hypothetical protein|tara:strand:- start:319 stop:978 length:660 start_codon:yes stop_codon:yes gene_type:complete